MFVDITLDRPHEIRVRTDNNDPYIFIGIGESRIGVHGTLDQLAEIGNAIVREVNVARKGELT